MMMRSSDKMLLLVVVCGAFVAAVTASEERRVPDRCQGPMDVGVCRALIPNWYYDAESSACKPFNYGGCGGNDNRFSTEQECADRCLADQGDNNITMESGLDDLQEEDVCAAPMVTGPCAAAFLRWYYDAESHACQEFTYGGCQGNKNNFKTSADCMKTCSTARAVKSQRQPIMFEPLIEVPVDLCHALPEVGPCRASLRRWFYNAGVGTCEEFVYGGCKGNHNNFESRQECMDACRLPSHGNQAHEQRQNDLFVHVLGVLVAVLASLMVLVMLFLWMQRLRQRQTHLPEVFTVVRPNAPKQDDTEQLIPNYGA